MANNPNLENLLQMGITAAKSGNREGAARLLQQVIDGDPKNDRAWVWMAYIATDAKQRALYLENALRINPNNKTARDNLAKMQRKRASVERRTLMFGTMVVLVVLAVTALLCVIVLAAQ